MLRYPWSYENGLEQQYTLQEAARHAGLFQDVRRYLAAKSEHGRRRVRL